MAILRLLAWVAGVLFGTLASADLMRYLWGVSPWLTGAALVACLIGATYLFVREREEGDEREFHRRRRH